MTSTLPVTLGGMQLIGVEVPTFFDRVGRMDAAIHQVIGGDRVVQVLGPDTQRRELTGYFVGPAAAENCQLLEAMRDAGQPLLLTIGVWAEYVLVTTVVVRYAALGTVLRYTVQAEPLSVSLGDPIVTTQTILSGVLADMQQFCDAIDGLSTNFPGVGTLQEQSTNAAVLASTNYQSGDLTTTDLSAPAQNLQSLIGSSGAEIADVTTNASDSDLVASSNDLLTSLNATQALALGVQAGGYFNRANLLLAQLNGLPSPLLIHS